MKVRAHPPTDVHQGEHSPGDLTFLYNMAAHLQGSIALADTHAQQGQHSSVVALAGQIATTHGNQLARVDGLRARLGNAATAPAMSSGTAGYAGQSNSRPDGEGEFRWDAEGECEQRVASFELRSGSDGQTFEGYAAVFNVPAQIRDLDGSFEETIAPGAFARTLRERTPVLMFEHGKHPLFGSLPLGVINHAEEDGRGLYIRSRLTDNWLIQPVRDAVRDGGIKGMSFRFTVPPAGDRWSGPGDSKRRIHDLDMRELGPVVFPAYELTTAHVRSALDCIDCDTGRSSTRSAGGGGSDDAKPGNGEASRIRAAIRVLDVHRLHPKEHYRA